MVKFLKRCWAVVWGERFGLAMALGAMLAMTGSNSDLLSDLPVSAGGSYGLLGLVVRCSGDDAQGSNRVC